MSKYFSPFLFLSCIISYSVVHWQGLVQIFFNYYHWYIFYTYISPGDIINIVDMCKITLVIGSEGWFHFSFN